MGRHSSDDDSAKIRPNGVVIAVTVGAVALLVVTALFAGGHRGHSALPATATTTPGPSDSASPSRDPSAALSGLYALPAAAVEPEPCPVPPHHPTRPPPPPPVHTPAVPLAHIPKPLPIPKHTPALAAISGKGMWLTTWKTTHLDVPKVIAQAKAAGLTSLWVRTGGYKQGYYGDPLLRELLPPAHAAGIKVIAWDFPSMSDPAKDAVRVRAALQFSVDGQRVDGFSPDIETINEGTFNNPKRVQYYLSLVRRAARGLPVVATVMRPTAEQLKTFPYAAMAPYIDAYAPMDYWSCQEPGDLTVRSIQALAAFGRPVTVIGQAYDMGGDGGRPGMPTAAETWSFLDSAKRAGAIGASLWTYEQAGPAQWEPLTKYPW